MQNKAQLLQQFDQARGKMREALPGIDLRLEIYPAWTIKDVLAHLAGWDDATIAALKAFVAGDAPPVPAVVGIAVYNAQTVAERTALDYEHIVKEWEWVREQLKALVSELPPEKLEATIVSPWGPPMTVVQLITVMTNHEEEHAVHIQAQRANPGQPPRAHG